jgi:hypothetical protein
LDHQWHHIAGVYDSESGATSLYLDGSLIKSSVISTPVSTFTNPLQIGYPTMGAPHVLIDEARLSATTRYTSSFDLFASPFACDEHTRALWHFDEIENSTMFYDACDNHTLIGYNDAHTGSYAHKVYLPLIARQS